MSAVEFSNPTDYPEAVRTGFEEDLVVVRGLVGRDFINSLNPRVHEGKPERTILNPFVARHIATQIPGIREARKISRQWIRQSLGLLSLIETFGVVQIPTRYRTGGAPTHIDQFINITTTSINLGGNGSEPTMYYAERISKANTAYIHIEERHRHRQTRGIDPRFWAELDPGDAVITSRGVEHKVKASQDRSALLFATRSLGGVGGD
jgi:hypothetical protein